MPEGGLAQHHVRDLVLQVAGVGEEQRPLEADEREVAALLHALGDGADQGGGLVTGERADHRPHVLVEEHQQAEDHAEHDALVQVGREPEGAEKTEDGDEAVVPLGPPGVEETGDVDQADDRHHDDRRQHRLGQVVEERGEEQQDQSDSGAGEETILARVGEGIVTTIGSADSHKLVLENPDMISKRVLEKGLDAGTAYEILSIDIADVDVGKNIGAALETDRAEADKKIAQAKAEERRAMAFAVEQEMKARVEEMRAKVVEAESRVPLAISYAFKEGNLGIMDYYRMRNIDADTRMRTQIAADAPSTASITDPNGKKA